MGRSVARPADPGTITVYARMGDEAIDDWGWDACWTDTIAYMQSMACRAWPSMAPADEWAGDELRVIARNNLASLVVSEYCGLVSISLVPSPDHPPLAQHWVHCAAPTLRKIVRDVFGDTLRLVGTASNGESFFRRDAE